MDEKRVNVQEARTDAISPYGEVAEIEGRTPAFDSDVFSFWNDLSVGDISAGEVSFGMVWTKPGSLSAPMLERHMKTTETIVPLDEDIVLVLAEPSDGETPDLNTLNAFRIRKGTAITLKKGTWHYVPLIPAQKEGRTLIVFRRGTPDDDLQVHEVLEKDNVKINVIT